MLPQTSPDANNRKPSKSATRKPATVNAASAPRRASKSKSKDSPTKDSLAKDSPVRLKDSPMVAANEAALVKRSAANIVTASKILVTGGTGFLGAHIVRELIADGETQNLRVMANSIPAWLRETGVETFAGSILDAEALRRALENVTTVYHLAGRVSRDEHDAHEMYKLHVEGTRLLCQAARQSGVKTIVLASSSGTIAVSDQKDLIADESWLPPLEIISRWGYYASKFYQERAALENFDDGEGRRLVIMNPSLLLGPGDERLSSTRVVLDFLARKLPFTPSGGLNFVDARDAARAFITAARLGRHGERYLLGAENWSFAEFFARLSRISKIAAPRVALPSKVAVAGARVAHSLFSHWKLSSPVEPQEVSQASHFWYFDWTKAETELGFTPRDPAETLHDTVEYVRKRFLGKGVFD